MLIQIQHLLLFNYMDLLRSGRYKNDSNTTLVIIQRDIRPLRTLYSNTTPVTVQQIATCVVVLPPPQFKYNTCYCSTWGAAAPESQSVIQIQHLLLFNSMVRRIIQRFWDSNTTPVTVQQKILWCKNRGGDSNTTPVTVQLQCAGRLQNRAADSNTTPVTVQQYRTGLH